ncbi:MAG: hypothetical protein ACQEQC_06445 [Elusimicrobiota bacterium]
MPKSVKSEIFYNPGYEELSDSASYPFEKYRLIKKWLLEKEYFSRESFQITPSLSPEELSCIHTKDYIYRALNGDLSVAEQIQTELKYPKKAAEVALSSCTGVYLSGRAALEDGGSVFIGGGFTHAHKNRPGAFTVFNDVAYGALKLARDGRRVLILDCDLHQADGTISILKPNKNIRVLSFYSKEFYPIIKETPDRGFSLSENISGKTYNNMLKKQLKKELDFLKPDIIIYIAGACSYKEDLLGDLKLEKRDFIKRDEIVLNEAISNNISVSVLLGGGKSKELKDTVDIHTNTIEKVLQLC